jgi:hypothetical protein
MAITSSQKQLDINSMRPGRPIVQVEFEYAEADTGEAVHTFTQGFAGVPDLVGAISVAATGVTCSAPLIRGLTATTLTVDVEKATDAVAKALINLQGRV